MDITSKIVLIVLVITTSNLSNANPGDSLIYMNATFANNIASVQFHPYGNPSVLPIITLKGSQRLFLEFDDLDGDFKRYTYTVIHCNRDWTVSEELFTSDYLEGFEMEDIEEYTGSTGTYLSYTNYQLLIPNRSFSWSKSGNYILQVFDERNGQKLVLQRRFIVVNRRLDIAGELRRPTRVSMSQTHHEVLFRANLKNVFIDDPLNSVKARIVQNLNWDAAVDEVDARRITGDFLYFDHHNFNVLPAFKPFRIADLRSIRYRAPGVYSINVENNVIWVTMETDLKRTSTTPSDDFDINGGFVVESMDYSSPSIKSEYINVMFTLESKVPFFDKDVYLLGNFNSFQPTPEYKMTYIEEEEIYAVEIWLKQGVYDYYYALSNGPGDIPDWEITEGNWYQTNNQYHVILYYRPFGGRYDQVIGYSRLSF